MFVLSNHSTQSLSSLLYKCIYGHWICLEPFSSRIRVCNSGNEQEEKSCFPHSCKPHGWHSPIKTTLAVEEIATYNTDWICLSSCCTRPWAAKKKHRFSVWLHQRHLQNLYNYCVRSAAEILWTRQHTPAWLQPVFCSMQEMYLSEMMWLRCSSGLSGFILCESSLRSAICGKYWPAKLAQWVGCRLAILLLL